MFQTGDKVVHPMYGAGEISGIEEKKLSGVVRSYYVLRLHMGGMLVMVPIDSSEAIGVRPVMDKDQGEKVIAAFGQVEVEFDQNWNRRYRENMIRLKSGDLLEIVRVMKGLMLREGERGLSTGERKMLQQARQILLSELALSQSSSYEEIEERINQALA